MKDSEPESRHEVAAAKLIGSVTEEASDSDPDYARIDSCQVPDYWRLSYLPEPKWKRRLSWRS